MLGISNPKLISSYSLITVNRDETLRRGIIRVKHNVISTAKCPTSDTVDIEINSDRQKAVRIASIWLNWSR